MENMEELSNIIVLSDGEGNDVQFEYLAVVEYKGGEYAVLTPADDEEGVVVVLKIESIDEETDSYNSVDDETAEAVFEIFKEQFKDQFEF